MRCILSVFLMLCPPLHAALAGTATVGSFGIRVVVVDAERRRDHKKIDRIAAAIQMMALKQPLDSSMRNVIRAKTRAPTIGFTWN